MTDRHHEIATLIDDYLARANYAPSVQDIATMTDRSKSVAFHHLRQMRALGLVDWVEHEPRTIHLTSAGRQELRRARAGHGTVGYTDLPLIRARASRLQSEPSESELERQADQVGVPLWRRV